MKPNNTLLPSVAILNQLFTYDPKTGILANRTKRKKGPETDAGMEAGYHGKGNNYRRVKISGRAFYVHRVIWAIMHGEWPILEIDHANGITTDNRAENLRLATRHENSRNRCIARNNRSGFKGVSLHRQSGKWVARIGKNMGGKKRHLGLFTKITDAAAAYAEASKRLHGEFGRVA